MESIQLIVGLGNPDAKYSKTRHNIGAWFVSLLADASSVSLKLCKKFFGEHGVLPYSNKQVHLLVPSTYMNLSGISVSAIAKYYNISVSSILIAHDELDLAPGQAKIKFAGGSGGHNGIKDIICHLHSNAFWRLRFGIGHPGESRFVSDYVLHAPSSSELSLINQAITSAISIVPYLIDGSISQAQQLLHSNH